MKLGACHLWGDSLEAFRSDLRLAAELGFGIAAIGDSPAGWHELYISLAIAAQESPNAIVAPFVTSPFVRHPIINANAMCSLVDAYGDRFALGLSTGGSNVMAIGHAPANQQQIRDYFQALHSLFAGKPGEYAGAPMSALRHARRVPIYYSAFGAKALALAGEQADGVILFTSHDLDALDVKIAAVRDAAVRAGRRAAAKKILGHGVLLGAQHSRRSARRSDRLYRRERHGHRAHAAGAGANPPAVSRPSGRVGAPL
jgi:5,10-methylenetetrahydromethanopterin reductase